MITTRIGIRFGFFVRDYSITRPRYQTDRYWRAIVMLSMTWICVSGVRNLDIGQRAVFMLSAVWFP
jgi:hypothetical protein